MLVAVAACHQAAHPGSCHLTHALPHPPACTHAAGLSAGSAAMTRYLGEQGAAAPVKGAVAISPGYQIPEAWWRCGKPSPVPCVCARAFVPVAVAVVVPLWPCLCTCARAVLLAFAAHPLPPTTTTHAHTCTRLRVAHTQCTLRESKCRRHPYRVVAVTLQRCNPPWQQAPSTTGSS